MMMFQQPNMYVLAVLLVAAAVSRPAAGQTFDLPFLNANAPPKPQVPQQYSKYFDLQGPAKTLIDQIVGPRPGIIPPRNFDIEGEQQQQQAQFAALLSAAGLSQSDAQRLLASNGQALPGQGAFNPNANPFAAAISSQSQQPVSGRLLTENDVSNGLSADFGANAPSFRPLTDAEAQATQPRSLGGGGGGSSVAGIPNIFPDLPRAPVPKPAEAAARTSLLGAQQPPAPRPPSASVQSGSLSAIPQLATRPDVPTGGLGPLAALQAQQQQQYQQQQQQQQQQRTGAGPADPFAAFGSQQNIDPASLSGLLGGEGAGSGAEGDGGLLGSLLAALGLGGQGAASPSQLLGGFQGLLGQPSPSGGGQQQQGVLSNVLYNALTDGVVQTQAAAADQPQADSDGTGAAAGNGTLPDWAKALPGPWANIAGQGIDPAVAAQSIGKNMNLLQQLLQQPNSPLCTPKPVPVDEFSVDAFMGTWYQVLYSPPLSIGPCSMVSYKKLADVANGGPGTVFDTFEYTTEGTPFGPPRISSGYAILRAPGQLIYRTTNNNNDVNVHVISSGPINSAGQYEWVVMSVNCNYPLHVFARDPVVYKQKYEAQVNAVLQQRGLINGFSRLLNVVAPVDNTLCTFPPTLFNIQG